MTINKTKTTTEPRDNPGAYQEDATASATAPPMPTVWEGNLTADRAALVALRASLCVEACRELDVALDSIVDQAEPHRFVAAVIRYARAVDSAVRLRADWADRGSPMLYTASNGNICAHPLIKMIREAEADAARFAKALKLDPASIKGPPGRPRGGSSAADRKVKKLPPVLDVDPAEVGE